MNPQQNIILWIILLTFKIVKSSGDLQNPENVHSFKQPPWTVAPKGKGDNETEPYSVKLFVTVTDIQHIDQNDQSVEIEMFIRMQWNDSRLEYLSNENMTEENIYLEKEEFVYWKPDLYAVNAKKTVSPEIQAPPEFFKIWPNGRVLTSKKVNIRFGCKMEFRNYPFDTQICPLVFESYGHTSDKMNFHLRQDDVTVVTGLHLPDYNYKIKVEEEKVGYSNLNLSWGIFSNSKIVFILERELSSHMTKIFIPTIFFVILAWFALLIPMEFVPGRLVMKLTILLAINEISKSTGSVQVAYMTKMDVWLTGCMLHVVFALVEYPIVLALMKLAADRDWKKKFYENFNSGRKEAKKRNFVRDYAMAIEKVARILYPFSFIIFATTYWVGLPA